MYSRMYHDEWYYSTFSREIGFLSFVLDSGSVDLTNLPWSETTLRSAFDKIMERSFIKPYDLRNHREMVQVYMSYDEFALLNALRGYAMAGGLTSGGSRVDFDFTKRHGWQWIRVLEARARQSS